MKKVVLYFDPISPYVYMAFHKIPEFLKNNPDAQFEYVPVLFAGLLHAHGQKGPAEIPAKRLHIIKEILRFGKTLGVKMVLPPLHPYNPLMVLRVLTALDDNEERFKLARIFLKTSWEEGQDLSDPLVIQKVLQSNGYKADDLLLKASDPIVKNKLKENTEKAVSQHVFGVPSFVIDDEMFWGHDRMEHLALYLQGKLSLDQNAFKEMVNRPRGADRKSL